jgi:hypothetical protein
LLYEMAVVVFALVAATLEAPALRQNTQQAGVDKEPKGVLAA